MRRRTSIRIPRGERLRPAFAQLALIDFAFSLVSRESLTTPLPIGWQKDYDYQSPRMLAALDAGRNGEMRPTRELDWRCDMYSLAAMLKRYLPEWTGVCTAGWTGERYAAAKALILRIRDTHDAELSVVRPHAALIEETGARIAEAELQESLERGWTLAHDASASPQAAAPLTPVTLLTPVTKLATPMVTRSGRTTVVKPLTALTVVAGAKDAAAHAPTGGKTSFVAAPPGRRSRRHAALAALVALAAFGAITWQIADRVGLTELAKHLAPHEGGARTPTERSIADREPSPEFGVAAAEKPSAPRSDVPTAAASAPSGADRAVGSASTPVASPPSAAAVDSPPARVAAAASGSNAQDAGAEAPAMPRSSTDAAQTSVGSLDARVSGTAASKAAKPPARTLGSTARAPVAAPRRATHVRSRHDQQYLRAECFPHGSSLEPPAWLRTGKPPNPPGMIASEPRALTGSVATDSPREGTTSASAASARTERATASSLPAAAAAAAAAPAVAVAPSPTAAGEGPVALAGAESRGRNPGAFEATAVRRRAGGAHRGTTRHPGESAIVPPCTGPGG